ncbi:MAG: gluconate 2-dehydrogenase subunit 3 family protein [Acidobacteriaceae bacterium]|nr:gluconate 2-dehydrogenase subunit 3 family protein [Acidobacteriaceae bacterium]MBV9441160.1 gluconate 2-dehydrogenase subunit 3 family protein [Acidobacteriaceae bacterium]
MNPSRRGFLKTGVAAPVLVSAIQPAAQALPQQTQTTLKTVMDLIIPAGDGMPSASEAGGMRYLENLMQPNKDVASDLQQGLDVVEAFSQRSFNRPFADLEKNDQIAVLKQIESTAAGVFDRLRAYVYESYYTQPAIWKRIGYELYPTDHMGPHMKPFDDSLLANVRKMPKLYKDV